MTIFRRWSPSPRSSKYARISSRPGELALAARGRLEADRVEAGHLEQDLLEVPLELERALDRVLAGERMEVAEARQADEPLVDARVVLHRAGAERVEAGVDAEVAVESFVKWRRTSGSASSGRRGGSLRARLAGTAGTGRSGRGIASRAAQGASARRSARSWRERLDEPVDLGGRALLGDGDEQRVVEARVVAAERVTGMDAVRARGPDRVAGVPSGAYCKLLECCPSPETRARDRAPAAGPSRTGRAPCRSPPSRAAPAARAARGAPGRPGRAASGWW